MAEGPIPNPTLEKTCLALAPLGWQWNAVEQACIAPAGVPTVPTVPPIPGQPPPTTTLPTGHVLISEEELARLERVCERLRMQRIGFGIGGVVAGTLLGALIGWAVGR